MHLLDRSCVIVGIFWKLHATFPNTPLPPYIKDQGGGAAGQEEARQGGVLLPSGVGLPPFLVGVGEGEEEEAARGTGEGIA